MANMLKCRLVLKLGWHHLWFNRSMMGHSGPVIIVVVVHILSLPAEISRTFMLVCSSILKPISCDQGRHGDATYILISCQDLSNITARVLIQLLIIAKDNDCDVDRTKD
jgi:hypothetical protein